MWFDPARPEVSQVALRGALLEGTDPEFDKAKLIVTPIPTGPGEVTISSDIVVADYPIKIEGKVIVTECPN